jgi:EAL domain-containing protein (putative c-di-GMP-specific phosphodiesterase class I)
VLGEDSILPERLELRISERTYLTRDIAEWQSLADRGVQFVVDEVGRKMSSIERLARAPLSALQLDRACAGAVAQDPTAAKVGRAVASVARALGLIPIATAVDSAVQRRTLLELGYTQGIGDVFVCPEAAALQADRPMSEG